MKKPDDWTGIRRHGQGWRATVSQGRDKPRIQKHFPRDTPCSDMQQWRRDTADYRRLSRKPRATKGTFAADAAEYLRSVTALPTYRERKAQIAIWIGIFGTQARESITPGQIRKVRDEWLTLPRAPKLPPLAPGTVNKRLRALSNVWTVLDGKHAQNPVRDVPEAREPDPEPRMLDYPTIAKILASLPDVGVALDARGRPQAGAKRPTVSKAKIRLACLAYCPITPKQLGQLQPADLDLVQGRIRLPARAKGRGSKASWQPLLPDALDAFTRFDAHDCYGPFSASVLRKSFQAGIDRAGLDLNVRVYDLRHAFGALAYRATLSLEAVAKLLQHRSTKTTERYAAAAESDVVAQHGATVAQHFGTTAIGEKRKQAEISGASVTLVQRIRPRQSAKISQNTQEKVGGR